MTRAHISLKTRLAAAVCALLDIPHEHAELMHEDQVLSLVQWDHYPVRYADGIKLGKSPADLNHHSNIQPLPIMAHRKKTSSVDIPQMAKSERCAERTAVHEARMASKLGQYQLAANILGSVKCSAAKKKIPTRANAWPPKGSRKFQRRAVSAI